MQSPLSKEKSFNQYKQFLMKKNSLNNTKGCNLYNNESTFVSPIYTFSLAGNIIIKTPIQGANREKYFIHIFYRRNMPTLAGNKHSSVPFFSLRHLSTENIHV